MKPILRDGILSWLVLLVSVIVGWLSGESPPNAVELCDMGDGSYGMPSERSAWAVALYTYACLRRKDSWTGLIYGPGKLLRIPRVLWGFLLWCVAIPFTRYELQYNTPIQILTGVGIGALVGLLGSQMVNPRLILTRFQVFLLYYIVSSFIENNFMSDKKLLAFLFEICISVGTYITWRKNNTQKTYNILSQESEEDYGEVESDNSIFPKNMRSNAQFSF